MRRSQREGGGALAPKRRPAADKPGRKPAGPQRARTLPEEPQAPNAYIENAPAGGPGEAPDAPAQGSLENAPKTGPEHSPADPPEPAAKSAPTFSGDAPENGFEDAAGNAPEEEPEDSPDDFFEDGPDYGPEEYDPPPRFGRRVLRVLGLILGWFAMVALFVLLLVAVVSFLLYRSVTLSDLPQAEPAFAGQTLQETDFDWKLPVVGPLRRRFTMADRYEAAAAAAASAASAGESEEENAYAESLPALAPPEEPQQLEPVDSIAPSLRLPEQMESRLEITRAGSGEPVFLGSGEDFSRFVFSEEGVYDAVLTLSQGEEGEPDPSEPQGHYTYHFRFALAPRPQITLSSDPVMEGSVLRIGITGLTGEVSPIVTGELGSASFVRLGSGWAAYLALPQTFTAGEFTMEILYGDTRETVSVHAAYRQTQELDTFTADGSAAIPYFGAPPENVRALFEIADPEIYWAERGFVQPVQGRPVRNYAVIEYTDRIVDKELMALDPEGVKAYNDTIPGRRSVNVTFATRPGAEIVAPADGRVVFAGLAGGSRCVVIEHGCGLKSLFYLLGRIDVSEGDYVSQGALLGTAQGHTVCEVRLGDSPINPWEVWGNYGGLAPVQ